METAIPALKVVSDEWVAVEARKGIPRAARRPRLTERDRALLVHLARARYLTTAQLGRLMFAGKHESRCRKRLYKLAGAGNGAFSGPLVRRLRMNTAEAEGAVAWTLTERGTEVVELQLGEPLCWPDREVSSEFLSHSVQLSELLVGLLETGTGEWPKVREDRFCWRTSDAARLPWHEYNLKEGRRQARVIVPDAVLDVARTRKRYFLECETGSHSIEPRNANKAGATLNKVHRYAQFFTRVAQVEPRQTFYEASFPDGYRPEVLFLVRNTGRKERVNRALAAWRAQHRGPEFARATTFGEAIAELRAEIGAAVPIAQGSAASGMRKEELRLMRTFFNEVVTVVKAERARARAEGRAEPEYPPIMGEVRQWLVEKAGVAG